METLPKPERYSYVFEGNSQVLDQMLVSGNLLGNFGIGRRRREQAPECRFPAPLRQVAYPTSRRCVSEHCNLLALRADSRLQIVSVPSRRRSSTASAVS